MSKPKSTLALGLEAFLADPFDVVARETRLAVLMNQASVDRSFRYAHTLIGARLPGTLKALLSPQHGLFSEQQDNMIESSHGMANGLPVWSLYSETRKPRPEMLRDIDVLVVDLQDVGTRVYTYVWTLLYCLEACAAAGVTVLVLDRPNPIGCDLVEGPLLDPNFASFVGLHAIPMRHGLTLGELARLIDHERAIGADLRVVAMPGYSRSMLWSDLGLAWVPTSPNMPRFETAQVYPGQVLLEGTNLSEGRGTTTPFEIFGAPWLDPQSLLRTLERFELEGCQLRPIRFEPTFHKFAKAGCGGLFVHVTDARRFRPYRTTLAILAGIGELWPEHFAWRLPPYEYETEKMPIDILHGNAELRIRLAGKVTARDLDALACCPAEAWWTRVRPHLLYG